MGPTCNPPLQEKDLRLREMWYKSFQANDNAKEALTALLDDDWGPSHVFNGLLETLPPEEHERIACFRPSKKSRKEVAAASFDAQRHYLQSFQPAIFGKCTASNCVKHPGSQCPLFFPVQPGEYRVDALPPLLVGFAGFMCTPWSPQGPQLGAADPSIESYNFWKFKMVNSPLDMVYAENSPRFPFKDFQDTMEGSGKWKCYYAVFGPEDCSGHMSCDRKVFIVQRIAAPSVGLLRLWWAKDLYKCPSSCALVAGHGHPDIAETHLHGGAEEVLLGLAWPRRSRRLRSRCGGRLFEDLCQAHLS